MYSLLNLLIFGKDGMLLEKSTPEAAEKARNMIYLSYLSHIEFRLYENFMTPSEDPKRFRVEVTISPEYSRN